MKKRNLIRLSVFMVLILFFAGCSNPVEITFEQSQKNTEINEKAPESNSIVTEMLRSAEASIQQNGRYSSPEEVAAYLHLFKKLPSNYMTKKEAAEMGWESNQGNLWKVTDRMSIGGDIFSNREGTLPSANGRRWKECDVNYTGGFRNAERITYSNDGLIFYTNDHYATFVQFY